MNREDELQKLIVAANFRDAESFIHDNNLEVDVQKHGWVESAAIFGALNGDVEFLKFLGKRDPALFNRRRLQTLLVGTYPDRSLLYYACKQKGMVDMVKYLIQFCDCNADTRVSPLVQAVLTGDAAMVDALLQDGAAVNEKERSEGVLLLQLAAARRDDQKNALELVSLFLSQTGKQRVHVNQVDGSGETALYVAAKHNMVDVATLLLHNAPRGEESLRDRLRALELAKEKQSTCSEGTYTAMMQILTACKCV
jgi:Ankyrin repeats (3 copies)